MPTAKPRISFALDDDLYARINHFRHDREIGSLSQALIMLLNKGLDELDADGSIEKELAATGELSDNDLEFMDTFDSLNDRNQRLLLGIGAVILQEQQKPPD